MELAILYYLILPISVMLFFINVIITIKKFLAFQYIFFNIMFITILSGILICLALPLFSSNNISIYNQYWTTLGRLIVEGATNITDTLSSGFPEVYRDVLFLNTLIYGMIHYVALSFFLGVIPAIGLFYFRKKTTPSMNKVSEFLK
ncbi:hypothetical protein [Clostridium sp. CF012]|uniref:hypothetical protein n=1 Tax=Clostridium sp. CF012 TaxID=2843319 RepID=UPI001C0E77C1|nr:hypothetical protein [Clostridium sp. CF012]MBU3146936.1 hypothetical protein [Clostridium sp. CF012]